MKNKLLVVLIVVFDKDWSVMFEPNDHNLALGLLVVINCVTLGLFVKAMCEGTKLSNINKNNTEVFFSNVGHKIIVNSVTERPDGRNSISVTDLGKINNDDYIKYGGG